MDVGSTNDLKPESLICVRRKGIFEAAADEAGASSIGEKTRKKLADYSGDTLRGDTAAARFFVIVRASARGGRGVLERQRRTNVTQSVRRVLGMLCCHVFVRAARD